MIVTDPPTGPDDDESDEMTGVGVSTVKLAALLCNPPTATTTFPFPVLALVGTVSAMLVFVQLETSARAPLTDTELVPWL